MVGNESTIPDTADMLAVAAAAGETWEDMRPSVEFLRDRLDEIASSEASVPVEYIASGIAGLAAYQQSWSVSGLGLVLADLVDLLKVTSFEGGWSETTKASDLSLTQTARMLRALRGAAHIVRLSREHDQQLVSDEVLVEIGDLAAAALQTLLDHREASSGWRMHADTLGALSYATTGECVLAVIAGAEMLSAEERSERKFRVGDANVSPGESLTLPVVVNQSAWWLQRTHGSWVDQIESDQRSAREPWMRLSYAVALEAAAAGSPSPMSLRQGAIKLSSLWLDEFDLWGEFDGVGSAPTARGTHAAVRAMEALRAALSRQLLGVVDIPLEFEPDPSAEAIGTLHFPSDARAVLTYEGSERVELSAAPDQIKLLRVIAEAGPFGVSRQNLAMRANVPIEYIWTYLDRLNRHARAKTSFARPPLVHRLASSGAGSVWRLHSSVTLAGSASGAREQTA